MTKTLKDSLSIVKFYETTRTIFNKHYNQFADDYEQEMVRRAPEHRMDFEEYCLVVVLFMFKENNPRKMPHDKLFLVEAENLLLYYQQNHKAIKKSWDKDCDKTLFEWVLTSYDRHKADSRGSISLSDIFKTK